MFKYQTVERLRRLRRSDGWEPVESMTPELRREISDWLLVVVEDTRDGSRVVRLAAYDSYGDYWRSQWDRIVEPYRVTHWRMLPALPARGD